ncbi:MAG: prepilin-type N-terminal cleavage/methylation domain-containing protein [Rhodocyclaceae bacterium]|nr:prepilin-type N-terminal cleavage/methylation domain-containing protein [Rhodocyclaceae bacterium]
MQRPDLHYEIPDERLIAYSRIPLLDRLKWLDEVRRFTLAARAAPTVGRDAPVERAPKHQRGLTLIELIVFIVIVGVALAGVLTVLNHTTRHSADPLVRKQALAIGEAILEEMMLQPFTWCDPDDPAAATAMAHAGCATPENVMAPEADEPTTANGHLRSTGARPWDNANDYNGLVTTTNIAGGGPAIYTARVDVKGAILHGVGDGTSASAALRITVDVLAPGETIRVEGFRTRHSPNLLP